VVFSGLLARRRHGHGHGRRGDDVGRRHVVGKNFCRPRRVTQVVGRWGLRRCWFQGVEETGVAGFRRIDKRRRLRRGGRRLRRGVLDVARCDKFVGTAGAGAGQSSGA